MAKLAVALDFSSGKEALAIAKMLKPCNPWLKIGLELFIAEGPQLVNAIKELDFRIFLDLKFYDIPNTVGKAVANCARLGIDMLTLHLQGGERMCRSARECVADFPAPPLLIGVTSLTSFAKGEMPGIAMDPGEFGIMLAKNAKDWGLDGIVCSGHELAAIKAANPNILCVCPGIRPAQTSAEDQRRIITPEQAVSAGADFLVVGRPITRSADPLAAAAAILQEIKTSI